MRKTVALLAVALCVPVAAQAPSKKYTTHIGRYLDLRNRTDHEFFALALELKELHDPKVDAIMAPHIKKIGEIRAEIEKLGEPN
jgi:hypothetical protein